MIRGQRNYGSKHLSRRKARGALAMLLCGCTDAALASFTAEGLAGSYNVSVATAAEMLSAAKAARLRS